MSESPKRFEDWYEVDCNQCQRYYDNSCDGVQKGSKKACNSYLATREVVIPTKIKELEKRLRYLGLVLITLVVINLILWVVYIRG